MSSKTAMGIASLVTFPGLAAIMFVPMIVTNMRYPETAIGMQGLENVRIYCMTFVLSYVIAMLLIPVCLCIYAVIYQALTHEALFSKPFMTVISIIAMILYILTFPITSQFELQTLHNGYSEFPLVHAAMLWRDIDKDLKSGECYSTESEVIDLKVTNFLYKSSRNGNSRTISNYEQGVYDKNGNLLGQISRNDYKILYKGMFTYIPHSIETFLHSGLIKSIDGSETVDSEPIEIELVFDYDAGMLYRELLCEDEDLLPELYLWTQMDGRFAGGHRINGETEMTFKPMIPGYAEAWIELRIEGKAPVVISNVIAYDQTEYVIY